MVAFYAHEIEQDVIRFDPKTGVTLWQSGDLYRVGFRMTSGEMGYVHRFVNEINAIDDFKQAVRHGPRRGK